MSTFNIDRPFLNDMLKDIETGRIQLPDFQRGWVWDDYRIRSHWPAVSHKAKFFNKFNSEVIERFKRYNVPVIQLRSETPREAACLVFEKVNTRDVTLTVRKIEGKAPSAYLPEMQKEAEIDTAKMNEILDSHLISAEFLRADDFRGFFKARKEALLEAIEKAMGKKIIREVADPPDTGA